MTSLKMKNICEIEMNNEMNNEMENEIELLNKQCENKLVDEILSLPPLMKEHLLNISIKQLRENIKEEIKGEIYREIEKYLPVVLEQEINHKHRQHYTPNFLPWPEYELAKKAVPSEIVTIGNNVAQRLHLTTTAYSLNYSSSTDEEYIHSQLEDTDDEYD